MACGFHFPKISGDACPSCGTKLNFKRKRIAKEPKKEVKT